MVIEAGAIAGYLIAWAVRAARRAMDRVDAGVDEAVDATADAAVDVGLTRLHDLVAAKLGGHPALDDLRDEAGGQRGDGRGEVTDITRQHVELALAAAAAKDEAFARAVSEALVRLRTAEKAVGVPVVAGAGSTIFTGDARAEADHGGIAIGQARTVSFEQPSRGAADEPSTGMADGGEPADPPLPGRSGR